MTELYVRTDAQFTAALQNAQPGDTIYLAAGTYAPQLIRSMDTDIRITSVDPSDPAILTGLTMRDVSGIAVSDVKMAAPEGTRHAFAVSGGKDVSFDSIEVYGPDNVGSGSEVAPFIIRNSENVSVTNSEFHHVQHGVELLDVQNALVDGNSFHDIRTDGVRGGGVSNSQISNNHFTDFYPAEGDHPDAIQLWSTNQTESAENIKIIGNVIARGDGEPMQGIFIRDTNNDLPFKNVTIADNVIVGGMYHGISLNGVVGGAVTGNVVAGLEDHRSWLRVMADEDVTITGNTATIFMDENGRIEPAGNVLIPEKGVDYAQIVSGHDKAGFTSLTPSDVKSNLGTLTGKEIPGSEAPAESGGSPEPEPEAPAEPETPDNGPPPSEGPEQPETQPEPESPSEPEPSRPQPDKDEGEAAPTPEEQPGDAGREVHVSTDAQLKAAIADAEPGDTIYLAAGTYSPLLLKSADLDLTITSADADNPAILTGLTLRDVSGVNVSNLQMEAPEGTRNAFTVINSKDISFDTIDMSGAAGIGSGKEVAPFIIRSSENVSVTNSQFHDAQYGIQLLDVEKVTIEDNSFFDMVTGGVRGAGVSNSQISDNHFTDFHSGKGTATAIQFWSSQQDSSAENITISGNVIARGNGEVMQGISVHDSSGKLPFKNVTVTDNAVLGGAYHGIMLGSVVGGTVSDNVVAGFENQLSSIRVIKDQGTTVSGNSSAAFVFDEGRSHQPAGNTVIPEKGVDYSAILAGLSDEGFAALKPADVLDRVEDLVQQDAAAPPAAIPSGPGFSGAPETHTELRGGNGADKLVGKADNDLIAGEAGNDIIYGKQGDDHIIGGAGNDTLYGHEGNDLILGGDGDDLIGGGLGNDIMSGGAGADYFLFRDGDLAKGSFDVITDFDPASDKWIHIREVDANVNTAANDKFTFIGEAAFSGTAGELNYSRHADGVLVTGDLNGDAEADFGILLQGLSSISADDFLL